MWLGLLSRVWPYLLIVAALSGAAWWLHHSGYESGYAAAEAKWQPRFAAAEEARAAADAKARQMEEDSKALSERSSRRYDETLASLNLRAADAERRYSKLLRDSSARASCGAVPQDGPAAGDSDAAAASDQRSDRIGRALAGLARRCEGDARSLAELQSWVRDQFALQH